MVGDLISSTSGAHCAPAWPGILEAFRRNVSDTQMVLSEFSTERMKDVHFSNTSNNSDSLGRKSRNVWMSDVHSRSLTVYWTPFQAEIGASLYDFRFAG